MHFAIDGRSLGASHPVWVVAEVGQAHDGSLGAAHAYIDAVAGTGAHAVKFQMHIAAEESQPGEPFRVPFSYEDASRYAYWQRMEFSPEHWAGLARHAREVGLTFLATPFSLAAVELLERLELPAWKIGSGDLTTTPLLDAVATTRKPVLLSTGMATWTEIDDAVRRVQQAGAPVAVYQCTSEYPCPPSSWGLNLLGAFRERYACPVGLSDHSGGTAAGLAACALGADMLEVHVVFSRACFGPDTPASLTLDELQSLCQGAQAIREAHQHPIDLNAKAESLATMRQLFQRSIVCAHDLPAGTVLEASHLGYKKPAGGLPPSAAEELLGRRLRRDLRRDHLLEVSDVE